ncbi:ribose 5-phosphate isomerase B [Fluviispira multicolorata]|uniref:Ribose 5-phosphate isomerase B n=1 Tax=Fluviispira multicolorata TaxID=2654512 RepID=A0A833N4E9_9BACT|nr:ribose 5-phosphate isomerase B [Fluviispira multicolorata]KAB8027430.1 ribose 5-phosphate isomerase B [Fluviispira multicolorata]
MKIAIAADHAGKELKSYVIDFLTLTNHQVLDYGVASDSSASVDYPDYADIVASEVSASRCDRGILICGTGIGMCITANKFPLVRAAVVNDEFTARMSRAHNDSNIMCLGSRIVNYQRAIDFVKIWLATECEEGRHRSRINKVSAIEKRLAQ